jgi:hypothetical protein
MLDVWPPLLIQIQYYSVDPQVEDNLIAALEHPNRVRGIFLSSMSLPLERLVAVMQEPFPAMDFLFLQIKGTVSALPIVPNTFLGGSAPRLRSLTLDGIPFPTLPQLLLSSNDLVDLALDRIPQNGYISPEAMATCISASTRLTNLSIGFISPTSRPDPAIRHPPPLTRVVLPALTKFDFHGVSQYLEDLMARTDAPLLRAAHITFFNQLIFDIQQLPRFIGHAPALMPFYTARIKFDSIYVAFSSRRRSSINEVLKFKIPCIGLDWQVSSVAQICNQLSFVLSSIEELYIEGFGINGSLGRVDMDETQWLELFQPFTAVQTLRISDNIQSRVLSALRGLSGELATQVLPALEELQLGGYYHASDNWPFIIARLLITLWLSANSESGRGRILNAVSNPFHS